VTGLDSVGQGHSRPLSWQRHSRRRWGNEVYLLILNWWSHNHWTWTYTLSWHSERKTKLLPVLCNWQPRVGLDGCSLHCSTISSCQSTATSEIVKCAGPVIA